MNSTTLCLESLCNLESVVIRIQSVLLGHESRGLVHGTSIPPVDVQANWNTSDVSAIFSFG